MSTYVQSFMFKFPSDELLVDSARDVQRWESFETRFPVYV